MAGVLFLTDFSCNVRVQAAENDVAITEFARLALLDDQIAHGAHGCGLLPLDRIAVLLACGLRRRADGDELQEGVVLEEEDEALAHGAGGAEDTWMEQHTSARRSLFVHATHLVGQLSRMDGEGRLRRTALLFRVLCRHVRTMVGNWFSTWELGRRGSLQSFE